MPWVLLALLAGAGGLYYETNKGRATNVRWELHFPASSAVILVGLMDSVTPLGGTVLDQGNGVYVVSVPAKVDLAHALPPNLVPSNMVISGASLTYLQADDRIPVPGDVTGAPAPIPPGPHEPIVAGVPAWRRGEPSINVAGFRWNGRTLQ